MPTAAKSCTPMLLCIVSLYYWYNTLEPYIKGLGYDLHDKTSSWIVHYLGYWFVCMITIVLVLLIDILSNTLQDI